MPNKISFFVLFCVFLGFLATAQSQSFDWWNQKHQWDGITHWHQYLRIKPAYMGPNALPVPPIETGILPQGRALKFGMARHGAAGDLTINPELECYLSLYSERVGLQLSLAPLEYYKTDTLTRDLRRARGISGEGLAAGDLYIGTRIQLVYAQGHLPDISLSINLKTASGSKLSDARFTDTPGYYFVLAFGKSWDTCKNHWRVFASTGFYVWQTFGDRHYQNDAILYGVGFQYERSGWQLTQDLSGYNGYIGGGDKPAVYRINLRKMRKRKTDFFVGWQKGLRDYPFASWRAGLVYKGSDKT